jgi:hypothetical protein
MRSTQLRTAICAFVEEAASVLAAATAAGDEVGFEIVEERGSRGRGTPLYCYRPLTGEFIGRNAEELARLETYLPAAHLLAATEGVPAYLQARGVAHPPAGAPECAAMALRLLLAHTYENAEPAFEFSSERFEQAFSMFQRAALDGRTETVIVALVRGLVIRSPEVALVDGVTLMQPEAFDLLPAEAGWPAVADGPIPSTLAVLNDAGGSVTERLRSLLRALRLFSAGVSLEPLAWVRTDNTAWRPLPLGVRGAARGAIVIAPEQEDELRAFCSLVARRAGRESVVSWALRRFELGCEQDDPLVAISDHLLALRALLEPEGQRSGQLAGRLAALCALPPERPELAERVAHAISLERSAISGLAPRGRDVGRLVEELAEDLRALLRDVLCGHLDADLVAVADSLIASAHEPAEADADSYADVAEPAVAEPDATDPDETGPDVTDDDVTEPAVTHAAAAERAAAEPVIAVAAIFDEPGEGEVLTGEWPAADPYAGQRFRRLTP